jgi:peptidoglycan/LPS O-acetylase OafA/YrhL
MAPADRIPALTGLRGIAALWVLVFHAWALAGAAPASWNAPWSGVASAGWLGVDVFFVLSGFLLALGLMREGASADGWRVATLRAARILPAYWAQLMVLAGLGALGAGGALAWRPDDATAVVAHLVLWLNAWPWVTAHLGPWWSLSVEVVFYLSLPLVLWALRRPHRAVALLVAAAMLAVLWRMQMQAIAPGIEQRIGWAEHAPGRWVQFVAGALLARAWHEGRLACLLSGWRADVGVLLAALALMLLPMLPVLWSAPPYRGVVDERAWTWAWPLMTTVPVAMLLWSAASEGGLAARVLASAPLRFVGTISFGLYLWHYPVQWALRVALGGYVPPEWGLVGFTMASLALSMTVASASWWVVERPVLDAAQRWAQRRRGRLPAP